jgi:hypothetical protein
VLIFNRSFSLFLSLDCAGGAGHLLREHVRALLAVDDAARRSRPLGLLLRPSRRRRRRPPPPRSANRR